MSHADTYRPFPLIPLIMAGTAVTLAILAALFGHLNGVANSADTTAAVATLDLKFADRRDGGVDIFDDRDGHTIEVVAPGTNGFLRATLRGLATERKRESQGAEVPFRLTAFADGRLTLLDPVTGRLVDLGAFGRTNEDAFAHLMLISVGRVAR